MVAPSWTECMYRSAQKASEYVNESDESPAVTPLDRFISTNPVFIFNTVTNHVI